MKIHDWYCQGLSASVRQAVRALDDLGPAERRALLGLAYRMLGSTHDAEDVVQETYSRWYTMPEEERRDIRSPIAWLTRVAGRICLDQLSSARARRERYVGEWIPEPLPDHGRWSSAGEREADPADLVTLDESVSMGMLVVLESVTPAERVAFVLHDVFGLPFTEIAEVVGRSPAACRQLAVSARRRIAQGEPRPVGARRHREVVSAFKRACESGDFDGLIAVLDPGVRVHTDGGGKVRAGMRPVLGAAKAARLFLGLLSKQPGLEFDEERVNGRPGLVLRVGTSLLGVVATEAGRDGLTRVWIVVNPDKLRGWSGGGHG